jgi:Fe-S cluster assembly ATPase SufC
LPLSLDSGCWAGHSIYPNTKMDEVRMVALVKQYGKKYYYITPDYVHVMDEGRIIKTGDKELALELERRGYDWVADEYRSRQAA